MSADSNIRRPRPGPGGVLDRLVGPGATRAELALQFGVSAVAAVAAPFYAYGAVEHWSLLQYAACCVLAFDVAGGIVTGSTSTAKRWYHRPGRGFRHHMAFVSIHVLHLAVVSWLFLSFDGWWLALTAAYLLGAAAVVLAVPKYLQRPAATTAYLGALLLATYAVARPIGLEWFLPAFYLKLLVSHLPAEATDPRSRR